MQSATKDVEIKTFARATVHKLLFQQAKIGLRIKNIFKVIPDDSSQPEKLSAPISKLYKKPTAKKLTPEQAKLLLIGYSTVGTEGAIDLLGLIFSDPVFPNSVFREAQSRPD